MMYVIATIGRTGSYLLCDLLSKNKVGDPKEDLNTKFCDSPLSLALAQGLSTEEYIKNIQPKRTVGGMFGTKIMAGWLDHIRANMATPTFCWKDMVIRLFPSAKFIYLTRCDRIGQAISMLRAMHTDQWKLYEKEHKKPWNYSSIMPEDIHQEMLRILESEQKWVEFFNNGKIDPLHIRYEDLIDDRLGILKKVIHFVLGVVPESLITESKLCKQGDEQTEICRNEYIKAIRENQYLSSEFWL